MGLVDSQFYRISLTFFSGWAWIHIINEHIATHTQTSGPSMYPSLPATYSHAVIKCTKRLGRDVEIGDVVVAKHPWFVNQSIGKRVLGMPGDYVILDPPSSNHANVEGMGLASNGLIGQETKGMMVQVPEGHCWLGGDNLPWSRDSRHYGPVPLGLIMGQVIGVWNWRWTPPFGTFKKITNTLEPVEWEEDADAPTAPGQFEVGLQKKEKETVAQKAIERVKK